MKHAPWHSRLAIILALLLPVFFAVAALGTKSGWWSWQTGLLTLTIQTGPILIGAVALVALVSLIAVLIRKPRSGWLLSLIALLIPVGIFAALGYVRSQAGEIPPIHDIATDVEDPPVFSQPTMDARVATESNPLNDYQTPLGEFDMYKEADPELAQRSLAQIIPASYPDLAPLPLGQTSEEDALVAISVAMSEMGFDDVVTDVAEGRVEGVAETFWFGFKDDVVARVADGEIDFRSVSRVGMSDLGANAARIGKLREAVATQLNRGSGE